MCVLFRVSLSKTFSCTGFAKLLIAMELFSLLWLLWLYTCACGQGQLVSCAGVQKLMVSVRLLLLLLLLCILCRTSLSDGFSSAGWLWKSEDLSVLFSVVEDADVVCMYCIGSTSLRPGKKGKRGN